MFPLRLVFKHLFKHPVRTGLTVFSLAVAVFLVCVLRSLVVALDAGVRASASNRVIVQSAVSLFVNLPEAYETKIRSIEGVENVLEMQWFGAYYQEPSNFFAQFAVDENDLLDVYDEIELIDGNKDDWLNKRTSCLIGAKLAKKYDFEVGQSIPLIGTIFPRTDGSTWDYEVAGIYRADARNMDENTLYFHYDYLRESLKAGTAQGDPGAGIFTVKLDESVDRVGVMSSIEAMFDRGPQRVTPTSEAEFQAQFVSMVGNVPFFVSAIGTGVLIAIVLAVLNTMLMSGREQTGDVGVLKALGFSDGAVFGVLLSQSVVICLLGGAIGIALALGAEGWLTEQLGTNFPGFEIAPSVIGGAAVVALATGLVAGIAPAWRAARNPGSSGIESRDANP